MIIYATVRIVIPDGADPYKVIEEMDYTMSFEGVPLETEVMGASTFPKE